MQTAHPTLRSVICAGLLCALVCSGCASKYGEQTTKVNHYPQCYQPIADLRTDEHSVGKSTATGAAIGALGGALIGLLATGNARGALAGAAVGAGTGALAGFAYGKNQQAKRDEAFYAKYAQDLDARTRGLERSAAAAEVACQCYDREFKYAVAEFKAGRMGKLELEQRYEEIRSGLQEVSRMLASAESRLGSNDAEFQRVMREEEEIARAKSRTNAKLVAQANRDHRNAAKHHAAAKSRARDLENVFDREMRDVIGIG